jgi:hypothetical protein
MRRVEEGFGESIPAAVMRVYSAHLTIAGEVSPAIATHLHQIPKTLTSRFYAPSRVSLSATGSRKMTWLRPWDEREVFVPVLAHL